jgi:hypothetical protein
MFAKSFVFLLALTSFVDANAQSASAPEISTVAYCDLLSKPDEYDGKRVRFAPSTIPVSSTRCLVTQRALKLGIRRN